MSAALTPPPAYYADSQPSPSVAAAQVTQFHNFVFLPWGSSINDVTQVGEWGGSHFCEVTKLSRGEFCVANFRYVTDLSLGKMTDHK